MKSPAQDSNTVSAPALRVPRATEVLGTRIALPALPAKGTITIEECLRLRRSVRDYSTDPITLEQVSQLLWAAQGVTGAGGLRTAPSAGAIYPLRSYLLAANVEGLQAGFYRYDPDERSLRLLSKGDKRKRLAKAAGDQQCVEQCACALLLTGWYRRITKEFGEHGVRLATLEAGHIGQNWLLEAFALGLGAICLGKYDNPALKMLLRLPDDEDPLYLLLAGRR